MPEAVQEVPGPGRIGLDQLIALNDEIAALARAGMPLERGLLEVGRDLPGRLGAVTTELGQRLSRGESLPEALEAEGDRFPRLYRAVVAAGVRAGRLPAALEGLASYARSYADARRAVGFALSYPLIVLALASALFTFVVTRIIPKFEAVFMDFRMPLRTPVAVLARVGAAAPLWGPVIPLLFLALLALWVWSGRAAGLAPGRPGVLLRWLPWARSMLAFYEAANFAELLALLLEHGVPYPDAMKLAVEASGDRALIRDGEALAREVAAGADVSAALRGRTAFPPLLRWLLAAGPRQGNLVSALRHMGGLYRRRARHQAEKLRVLLPVVLLFAIGATAVLLYTLTLFLPYSSLLKALALD